MTALWLNVSTLMNWTRPPVGIVRVEREFVLWLLEGHAGGNVRFCMYDRRAGHFVEVSRAAVEERVAPARQATAAAPLPPRPPLPAWKRLVKGAWTAVKPWLPGRWRDAIARRARHAYADLLAARQRRREAAARKRQGVAALPVPEKAAFGQGDRWVSLGLDWDQLDQQVLFRLKREHALNVTLICYDTIPALQPQFLVGLMPRERFGSYLAELGWCADRVLCISECTRRDLERLLRDIGAPVPPTHILRLGDEIRPPREEAPPPGFEEGGRPFVLYVSTIERRKNHEVLYRAWTRMRDAGIEPHRLVFVGMRGWGVDELMSDLGLDPRVRGDVVILDHVDDAALAWLYRHAAFTVYPSLYEGWGLPVVESLGWGKFCLCSNAASLPEAGGDWVEYIDPWDVPRWAERLAHLMQHPGELRERNERIARSYRATPWSETCAEIHRVASLPAVYSPGQS